MNRAHLSNLLRKFRLIFFTDQIRYYIEKYKNKKVNDAFKQQYPEIVLPPDYLIYEAFQLNYQKYYWDSRETAEWLKNHFEKHIILKNLNILDWGCGPGRIIRHLPEVIGNDCTYFGTDYNEKTIEWCSKHLQDIQINKNTLAAKLPYKDNFFDVIYGISIFTHLSEQMHFDWYAELYRVLKQGGIMLLTTQGNNFKAKLSDSEVKIFNNNALVVRGKVKEGHRTFSAFQPKGFMLDLFANGEVLEHIELKPGNGKILPQDVWIVRKPTI